MVANHQSGEHQGGMKRRVAALQGGNAMKLHRRTFFEV
jgi:hypothetical protein